MDVQFEGRQCAFSIRFLLVAKYDLRKKLTDDTLKDNRFLKRKSKLTETEGSKIQEKV